MQAKSKGVKGRRRSRTNVKQRSVSSMRWLDRQLNDPYVANAKAAGYRSRAAYKLQQLDDKFGLLKPGGRVIDLGAAPGGWTQVAVSRVGVSGRVVSLDLVEFDPVPGSVMITGSATEPKVLSRLSNELRGKADLVLSDMASPTTGHAKTDHLRIMVLAETAYNCARVLLDQSGAFIVKILQGGADSQLLSALKSDFRRVRHVKPEASRSDSREIYIVALGFRGPVI